MDGKDTPWTSSTAATAVDSSGSGNPGTLTNMGRDTSPTIGKLGQALSFDGVDDYISIPDAVPLRLGKNMTVSAWVKPFSFPGFQSYVVKGNGGDRNYFLDSNSSGNIRFGFFNGSTYPLVVSATPVAAAQWTHIMGTYDGSNIRIYINGVLDNTQADTSTPVQPTDILAIGRLGSVSSDFTNGSVDDVRIYSRALSANEIRGLYNTGAGSKQNVTPTKVVASGPVGHWTFDGKDMTSNVRDASGQGNNGNLLGSLATTSIVGKLGQALSFDGTTQYISIPGSSINIQDNLPTTISAWVKTTSTASMMLIESWSVGTNAGFQVNINGSCAGNLSFLMANAAVSGYRSVNTCEATDLLDGNWHLVTITYDGSASTAGMKSYIDSSQLTTNNVNNTAPGTLDNSTTFIARSRYNPTPSYLNGSLDDVRIYSSALSANEIRALYNQGAATKQNVTPTPVGSSGLVGHWTFDGKDVTSTAAYDRSGQGNDGVLVGTPNPIIGKLGQAYSFTDNNDYISVNDNSSLDGFTDFTLSAWSKLENYGSPYATILEKGSNGAAYNMFFYAPGPFNSLGSCYVNSTNIPFALPSGYWELNKWYHIVCTRMGNTVSIYINNELGAASTYGTQIPNNADPVILGGNNIHIYGFPGIVDDVRIYNKGFSATDVNQLYKLGR